MRNKEKAQNILLVFMVVLFILQIVISYKGLFTAIASSDFTIVIMFLMPILIVLGSLVSMIKRILKFNKEK